MTAIPLKDVFEWWREYSKSFVPGRKLEIVVKDDGEILVKMEGRGLAFANAVELITLKYGLEWELNEREIVVRKATEDEP